MYVLLTFCFALAGALAPVFLPVAAIAGVPALTVVPVFAATAAEVSATKAAVAAAPAIPVAPASASVTGAPAGMILYAQEADGSVWLLLADHAPPSQRGWAAFGGAADAGETVAQTAARETEEETGGYFSRDWLLAAIKGQEPVFDGVFAFYFVKIDKVPVERIAAAVATRVAAAAAAGNPAAAVAYAERGPFAWIPYAQAERWLDAPAAAALPRNARSLKIDTVWLPRPQGGEAAAGLLRTDWLHTDWLWPVWLNNLRAAQAARAVLW